jgi:two-component system nitrogen regulation response regulator GlnG
MTHSTSHEADDTLITPGTHFGRSTRALLALTIVWHPDPARVGEQFTTAGGDVLLNRLAPTFRRPGCEERALGHGAISRDPLRILRDAGGVRISVPASRMLVEMDGRSVDGEVTLDEGQVRAGVVLTLGRAVVLCLHWMDCAPRDNPVPGVAGVGAAAIGLRDQIHRVAPTDLPVLLLGETGTGKEIAARAIHALGERRNARLVAVNMATLSESLAAADLFGATRGAYTGAQAERKGLFAEADGATLFLDEVGNAPAAVQPMLLRVLEDGVYRPLGSSQDKRSTARLIAATDQDLDTEAFNQALLRRLEGFVIQLPPLRSRREDIGVLILHLLRVQGADPALTLALPAPLVADFARHDWPGNVRQLAHALRRAVLMVANNVVPQFEHLVRSAPGTQPSYTAPAPAPLSAPAPAPTFPQPPAAPQATARRKPSELDEDDILDAMARHGWTIQAAACALGISRPTLYKLLEGHSRIRWPDRIPHDEIARAWEASGGDVTRCAALLHTPAEALRRHLRKLRETA